MPPIVEEKHSVVFVDGIYLCRNACVLICCDRNNVLGWYLCRHEHANAWVSLLSRIKKGFKKGMASYKEPEMPFSCVFSSKKIYYNKT